MHSSCILTVLICQWDWNYVENWQTASVCSGFSVISRRQKGITLSNKMALNHEHILEKDTFWKQAQLKRYELCFDYVLAVDV